MDTFAVTKLLSDQEADVRAAEELAVRIERRRSVIEGLRDLYPEMFDKQPAPLGVVTVGPPRIERSSVGDAVRALLRDRRGEWFSLPKLQGELNFRGTIDPQLRDPEAAIRKVLRAESRIETRPIDGRSKEYRWPENDAGPAEAEPAGHSQFSTGREEVTQDADHGADHHPAPVTG